MKKLLIIEDDLNLGTSLASGFEMLGYEVLYLTEAGGVIEKFKSFLPHAVITDVMLNDSVDGFQLAREIRNISDLPVLFTTSKDGTDDIKAGLGLGNSDFIRKPYRLVEVSMRLENLLRNDTAQEQKLYRFGGFSFDPSQQLLSFSGQDFYLPNYDTAVLLLLLQNKNDYVNRSVLVQQVWGVADAKLKEASLNNVLSRLRKYLSPDSSVKIDSRIHVGVCLRVG